MGRKQDDALKVCADWLQAYIYGFELDMGEKPADAVKLLKRVKAALKPRPAPEHGGGG